MNEGFVFCSVVIMGLTGCAPALTRVPSNHPARASAEAAPLPAIASSLGAEDAAPPPAAMPHHHHHGAANPGAADE